jgi:hypothetical protein
MIKIQKSEWFANSAVLIALTICQAIWFGPIIGKVGFYLDDWATFSQLANGRQNWQSLIQVCLNDPRIVIRPLESLIFVGSWLTFHDNPWGYHLLTCCFEIAASFFLYLSLSRLTANRVFAFIAGLLMLLYPSHDATHYWVIANCITLSLSFYILSLWQAIKAVQDQKPICFLFSFIAFLASLFTYESFLPLAAVTAACLLGLYKKQYGNWRQAGIKTLLAVLPYFLAVFSAYYYQRVFLFQMNKGIHHVMAASMPHILEVYKEGFSQTFLPSGFSSFLTRTHDTVADLNTGKLFILTLLIVITGLTIFIIGKDSNRPRRPYFLLGLGILFIFSAYTIYCTSPEYVPKLESIYNRLNTGAAAGAAIFISGLLALVLDRFKGSRITRTVLLTTLVTPIILFFVLANWGWSIPWRQSWTFQKYIIGLVKEQKDRFHDSDSIILAHTPRYVMWSPLFDGVWDFQAMLQLYLNAHRIQGNVVSDRLILSKDSIKDVSGGYLCGTYPYSNLFVFVPNPKQWIKTPSAERFIDAVQSQGLDFGLTKETIASWQKQLLSTNNHSINL